ncbi:hypothetical protein [Leucobacter manosquensis]|uniref:Uncharacterized protein n=1 Tax=Leucobacter manosquensis TaxID=2810611 RepID=A0ABS5M1I1_9MICO|nr:hypothetical protein [Leucobacter manosquensis]MBS3180690.1 hypothetical protein [Leucobacter manosquensis]
MQTEHTWSGSFRWHLEQVPWQLLHMRALAESTLAAQDTTAVRVSGGSEKARLPYRVDPADDADLLYATLVIFGREVAEKIGGSSPKPLRTRMWKGRDEPQGLPVCTPQDAMGLAAEICRWLIACTHQIAHDETLHDAPESLIDLIRDMRRRYPQAAPKFRAYRPRPCPTCGERTIRPIWGTDGLAGAICDACGQGWGLDIAAT